MTKLLSGKNPRNPFTPRGMQQIYHKCHTATLYRTYTICQHLFIALISDVLYICPVQGNRCQMAHKRWRQLFATCQTFDIFGKLCSARSSLFDLLALKSARAAARRHVTYHEPRCS